MTISGPTQILKIVGIDQKSGQRSQENGQAGHIKGESIKLVPGEKYTGIVTDKTANNTLILTLKNGKQFSIQADKPIPTGTQLTIQIANNGGAQILKTLLPDNPQHPNYANFIKGQNAGSAGANTLNIALPKLVEGSQHTGVVTTNLKSGVQTLTLNNGQQLPIQTEISIPKGTQLTLEIMQNGAAKIINTQAPAQASVQNLAGQTLQVTAPTLTQATINNGTVLTGTVSTLPANGNQIITLTGGQQLPIQTPLPLPTGTQISLQLTTASTAQITSASLPNAGNAPAALANITGQSATLSLPNLNANVTHTGTLNINPQSNIATLRLTGGQEIPLKLNAPIPNGITLNVQITAGGNARILSANAPVSPAPAASISVGAPITTALPNLSAGTQHTGVITAAPSSAGTVNLRLDSGQTIPLQTSQAMPAGTQVSLQITPAGTAEILNMILPQSNIRAETVTNLGKQWPALTQALNVLKNENPTFARNLSQTLPMPSNLLPGLSLFSVAASAGDAGKFMNTQALALLQALGIDFSADFSQLQSVQQRQDAPDYWRGFLFPYAQEEGQDPQQGGFFWRRQNMEDGDDSTNRLRFVVNLSLTHLGATQLDGLLHENAMRLKLRMQQQQPAEFEQNLRRVVAEILAEQGLSGSIDVEYAATFEVDPLSDILHERHGGFTLTA